MDQPEWPQTADERGAGRAEERSNASSRRLRTVCVLLAALTFAVFWPVGRCDFINYVDPQYVTANPRVHAGLTLNGIVWAFTTSLSGAWQPLTWLSHMLDRQLFGAGPTGPHLVNLLIHAANTVLLFLVLRQLSGAHWRSAWVAALFAVHPLHVESVAWVAERKEVLSTLFGLLTLLFYGRYVQESKVHPSPPRFNAVKGPLVAPESRPGGTKAESPKSQVYYGLSLLFFLLGLMSQPMLVSLPLVMLLLDYWPLGRVAGSGFRVSSSRAQPLDSRPNIDPERVTPDSTLQTPDSKLATRDPQPATRNSKLILEKVPFFLLSGVFCLVTVFTQSRALESLASSPLSRRIASALVAYNWYLAKTFWPVDLALPYVHRDAWPASWVAFSALLVAGLCLAAFALRRRLPFVMTGWFWFWGMLIPVIGLVPTGVTFTADRYTYLPLVGLFILVAWGAAAAFARWRLPNALLAVLGGLVLAAGALQSFVQLRYWRDSETLFRHTLAVTKDNDVAYNHLGSCLNRQGHSEEALECFHRAQRIHPTDYLAYNRLGSCFYGLGRLDEAITNYQEALRLNPRDANALNNLGSIYVRRNESDQAIKCLKAALRLRPDYPEAHNNLGFALNEAGKTDEAISHFAEALRLAPDDAEANNNFANILISQGKVADAIDHYRRAVELDPKFVEALVNLAQVLGSQGLYADSIACFSRALELKPDDPSLHRDLARVLAGAGRNDAALQQYREALRLDPNDPETRVRFAGILAQLGRRDEAIAQVKEALRLKPDDAAATRMLQTLTAPTPK